jgi:hypothetical protein
MASRLLGLAARTPNAEPAWRSAPSPHGAQHETVMLRRLAAFLPTRFAGVSRMVARAAFEAMFPGVPWADEGNDGGRGTAIIDGFAPDGAVAYGGHSVSLKSRVTEEGASLPSKNFDAYGPGANTGAAIDGLVRLHAEGKPLPMVAFFRTASQAVDGWKVVAWTGVDLPTLTAEAIARVKRDGPPVIKGCVWGVWNGLPELPPNHPKVGRGGYPGVTVYVTHPSADGVRGYRTLKVTLRDQTFSFTGEAEIAAWLATDGFPTRARKR